MTGLEFILPSTDAPPPRDSVSRTLAPRRDAAPEQFDAVMGRVLARPEKHSPSGNGSASSRRSDRPRKDQPARSDSAAAAANPPAGAAPDPAAKPASATAPTPAQVASEPSAEGDAPSVGANPAPLAGANGSADIDTPGADSISPADETDSSAVAIPDLTPVAAVEASKTESLPTDPDATAPAEGTDPDAGSPVSGGGLSAREVSTKGASAAALSGKNPPIDSSVVKVLNAQTVSSSAAGTTPDARGISVAQEQLPMQKAENMHESAGEPQQNLPVGPATPANSSHSEGLDASAALAGNAVREAAAPTLAPAATVTTTTDTSIVRSLERAHDMMSLHAYRLRDSGADALRVVIKPGSGLQLSLNLQMRGGGVEVQAQLNHGDFDFLSRHWNELQQQLEARGIRLAPLVQGEQTLGGAPDGFRNANGKAKEEDVPAAEAFAGLASPRSLVVPPAPVRSKPPRGWESWA